MNTTIYIKKDDYMSFKRYIGLTEIKYETDYIRNPFLPVSIKIELIYTNKQEEKHIKYLKDKFDISDKLMESKRLMGEYYSSSQYKRKNILTDGAMYRRKVYKELGLI